MMKELPLTPRHVALGAKMTDFAGYQMPLVYSTVSEEHLEVRNQVGLFDVSHMGEFIIKGKEALDLVQHVISNDASRLEIGQAQYAYLPNDHGGIVDDLLVYRLDEEQCSEGEKAFMLVVNAANIAKDLAWIHAHNSFETRVIDISDQTGLLALQGPQAARVLQPLTELELASIPYYGFRKGKVADCDNVLVSATGYTGAGGFEIYASNPSIVKIWDALMTGDQAPMPIGLAARDTLRLEKGYCLYGNDIHESTSPFEAGLGWITKLQKPDFVGKETLIKQKREGVVKKLIGFIGEGRRVPRPGYDVVDDTGKKIGEVTSGTFSPSLEKPIGMGYVDLKYNEAGSSIYVLAGSKKLKNRVTKLPFVKD